jgi:hypothetical protein
MYFVLCLALSSVVEAQFAVQAGSFGGAGREGTRMSVYDEWGHLYVSGAFQGTCDFAPGPATYPVEGVGEKNMFVARYGTDMQPDWVARFGGGYWLDEVREIATGSMGQVVVAGVFFESGDFDPGPGVNTLTSLEESDIFLAQLDSLGNLSWLIHLPDSMYDQVWDVAIDSENNVYMVGHQLDSVDVDPGPDVVLAYSPLTAMGYVLKYDENGNFLQYTSLDIDYRQVFIDEQDHVSVGGELDQVSDIDPGPAELWVDPANGEQIVIEYLPSGELNSYLQFDEAVGDSWGLLFGNLEKDAEGNVYIGGTVLGPTDVDPGPGQTIIGMPDDPMIDANWYCLKYLPSGELDWAASTGSTLTDNMVDLTIGPDGSVICAIGYGAPHDADPGTGVWMVESHGTPTDITSDDDALILVLDADGQFVRATPIWGGEFALVTDTHFSPTGELTAVGHFRESVTFDPPDGTTLGTAGGFDCFIAELDLNYWTGITEQAGSTFQLFPVPTDRHVSARSQEPFTAITVYDAVGTLVYSDSFSPRTAYDLQLEHAGTYLCRFMDSGAQVGMGRVVVVR